LCWFRITQGSLALRVLPQDLIQSTGHQADLASTYGKYEKYGELYIAPDKQPTVAALDIMTRMLMVAGLPQKARVSDSSSSSSAAVKSKEAAQLPRLCLTWPDRESLNTLDSKGVTVVAGVEARVFQHVIEQGRQIIEDDADAKRDFQSVRARSQDQAQFAKVHMCQVGELKREENLFNSMSFTFRSGQSMAKLYR
jgi:hypothetical protein